LPETELREIVGTSREVDSLSSKLRVTAGVARNFVAAYSSGTFDELGVTVSELSEAVVDLLSTRTFVEKYQAHYENYPETRAGFEEWVAERNEIDRQFYERLALAADERKY